MSYVSVGRDQEKKDVVDTDKRSRDLDDSKAIAHTAAVLKNMKEVKIRNVCGSTAGAGSGTFHKYRQCRRREQFRLQQMERDGKLV